MSAQPSESKRAENLAGLSAEAQKRTADRAGGLGNPYVCRGRILWLKQCRESAMQLNLQKTDGKISGRVTIGIFKKTAGVSACWDADRRGYDHSSGVKA